MELKRKIVKGYFIEKKIWLYFLVRGLIGSLCDDNLASSSF